MTLMKMIQMDVIDSEKLKTCTYVLEALPLLQILALNEQEENLQILQKMPEKKDVEMVLNILMKDETMVTLLTEMDAVMLVLLKTDMFEMEEMRQTLILVLNVQMGYLLMLVLLSESQFVEMEKSMKAKNEMMEMPIQAMVVVIHVP